MAENNMEMMDGDWPNAPEIPQEMDVKELKDMLKVTPANSESDPSKDKSVDQASTPEEVTGSVLDSMKLPGNIVLGDKSDGDSSSGSNSSSSNEDSDMEDIDLDAMDDDEPGPKSYLKTPNEIDPKDVDKYGPKIENHKLDELDEIEGFGRVCQYMPEGNGIILVMPTDPEKIYDLDNIVCMSDSESNENL